MRKVNTVPILGWLAGIITSAAMFSGLFFSQSVTAVPPNMNFQGRLTNSAGNIVSDGQYNMQFRIYNAASGGTALWTETRQTTNQVQVTNGLFSAQLGAITPLDPSLFNNSNLFFEITMATPATANCTAAGCVTWESPMTPRNKLAASAYAFNSARLNGKSDADFAAASGSNSYLQNTTSPQTASFNVTGSGQIGGPLTIGGDVQLSRGVANRLDLASGDSLNLVSGNIQLGGTTRISSAGVFTGSGAGITSLNASNLSSGMVADARLSSNVAMLGAAAPTFTGGKFGVTGEALFKNTTDSALAFQIQNSVGTPLLIANTTNMRVQIGSASPTTSVTVLVLDNKSTAGDPTGVNGAMYYNASAGKFRCYEGALWKDCIAESAPTKVIPIYNGDSTQTLTFGANDTYAAFGASTYTGTADLTNNTQVRLSFRSNPFNLMSCGVSPNYGYVGIQYSLNGTTWVDIGGTKFENEAYFVSGWHTLPANAKASTVFLRIAAACSGTTEASKPVTSVTIEAR